MGTKLNIFTGQLDVVGTSTPGGPVNASDVNVTPSGNLTSTNAQGALEELQGEIDAYSDNFNNTTDWSGPSGGYYTISYTEATHNKGLVPAVQIFEQDGANYNLVDVDRVQVNASGDVEIRVLEVPDLRFNGKILIK